MLLIFDLDGTLFMAKSVYINVARMFYSEMGVPAPDDETLLRYAGRSLEEFFQKALRDGADIGAARLRYLELMRGEIAARGELFPGAYDAVARLARDGHVIEVCSNSPEEYIRMVLEHTALTPFVSRYYSAEQRESKAELIQEMLGQPGQLGQLGQLEPVGPGANAIVIGDTHGDVEAAHKNGLPAIAAAYGYGNKSMLAPAEYIADSPDEIVDCVNRHAMLLKEKRRERNGRKNEIQNGPQQHQCIKH